METTLVTTWTTQKLIFLASLVVERVPSFTKINHSKLNNNIIYIKWGQKVHGLWLPNVNVAGLGHALCGEKHTEKSWGCGGKKEGFEKKLKKIKRNIYQYYAHVAHA